LKEPVRSEPGMTRIFGEDMTDRTREDR
jgi:hypothetical protein